jgi:hypothetical protein
MRSRRIIARLRLAIGPKPMRGISPLYFLTAPPVTTTCEPASHVLYVVTPTSAARFRIASWRLASQPPPRSTV